MAFERISLNIIPDGEMPVFHASQFDAGRPIIIDLYNGDDAYTPAAGVTFELHCRKVDDNIVTLDTYEVDGNTITFASTEQLCACSGDNLCEVAIMLDDLLMGTLNFILHVERDPIAGGLTSETSIYNLTQQIDDIISGEGYVKDTDLEVLQSDWNETDPTSPAYIKNKPGPTLADQADWTETDPLKQSYIKHKPDLKTVATTGSYNDLTDKPTIPTKTSELTNDSGFVESSDLATVATTGDYDDLINKPTIPAAQVQSDWNQTNTSAVDFIKNKPDLTLVKSATGNPCTFTTDLTDNLISVKANIAYNANGYTEANITRCGVNLFKNTFNNTTINQISYTKNTDGSISVSGTATGGFAQAQTTVFLKAGNYIISDNCTYPRNSGLEFYCNASASAATRYNDNVSFTVTKDGVYKVYIYVANGVNIDTTIYPMIRRANVSDTTYHPYTGNTYTIAFGQTVYGGVLDVTNGTLVSTLNADGTEKATPDIYTLTPTAIQALSGVNNIISDLGGDVEVKYVSGELAGQIIDICKMVIAEQGG